METSATDVRGSLTEIFGWAVPGYVLVIPIFLPLFFMFPESETLLTAMAAVSGVPLGFIWVYTIYQPIVWKRFSSFYWDDWQEYLKGIGRDMTAQMSRKRVSRLVSPNIGYLQQDDGRIFDLVDRLMSQIRETDPFLAFYHIRHHTLRDLGFLLPVLPLIIAADLLLVWGRMNQTSIMFLVVMMSMMIVMSHRCFKAAGDAYFLARLTYGLRFADRWPEMLERAERILRSPIFAKVLQ